MMMQPERLLSGCSCTVKQTLNERRCPKVTPLHDFDGDQPISDEPKQQRRDESSGYCKDRNGSKVAKEITLLEREPGRKNYRRQQPVEESCWGESQSCLKAYSIRDDRTVGGMLRVMLATM